MDKISIFGGTGYIGSHFYEIWKYSDVDYEIVPRDEFKCTSDHILYFISTTDNYNVLDDPTKDINTNLIHLMKVLDANKNLKSITFISSWFVYGVTPLPAREDSVCNPKGFYSITKKCAEDLLISFCNTYGIDYKIIRLANVYGHSVQKDNFSKKKNALEYLINEIINNRPISLYYNGGFLRDYIHVSDVCRGIRHLMNYGLPNEIYNLGCGKPIVFRDIINKVIKLSGSTSVVTPVDPPEFHKIVQVKNMFLDCKKLFSTGFECSIDIMKGIECLITSSR